MKNNLRRLQRLIQVFGFTPFNHCWVDSHGVICMGKFNPEIVRKAVDFKFKLDADPNGFIRMRRGAYLIVLT